MGNTMTRIWILMLTKLFFIWLVLKNQLFTFQLFFTRIYGNQENIGRGKLATFEIFFSTIVKISNVLHLRIQKKIQNRNLTKFAKSHFENPKNLRWFLGKRSYNISAIRPLKIFIGLNKKKKTKNFNKFLFPSTNL